MNTDIKKSTRSKAGLSPDVPGSGLVQVAVWKENADFERHQDIFTQYSMGIFYDFSKPLRLLDSPGWNSGIKTKSDGDFFVFTHEE